MKPYDIKVLRNMPDRFEETIKSKVYSEFLPMQVEAYLTKEPLPFDKKLDGKKSAIKPGDAWGELFDCSWFNCKGVIPKEFANKHVVVVFDCNGEACYFDNNGVAVQGLTTVSYFYENYLGRAVKRIVQISDCAKGGEKLDMWFDCANNDLFGNINWGFTLSYRPTGKFEQASIAICNDNIRNLYYDFYFTFTTQALNKYYNRRIENLLRSTELALSIDNLLNNSAYPKAELDKIWKEMLYAN